MKKIGTGNANIIDQNQDFAQDLADAEKRVNRQVKVIEDRQKYLKSDIGRAEAGERAAFGLDPIDPLEGFMEGAGNQKVVEVQATNPETAEKDTQIPVVEDESAARQTELEREADFEFKYAIEEASYKNKGELADAAFDRQWRNGGNSQDTEERVSSADVDNLVNQMLTQKFGKKDESLAKFENLPEREEVEIDDENEEQELDGDELEDQEIEGDDLEQDGKEQDSQSVTNSEDEPDLSEEEELEGEEPEQEGASPKKKGAKHKTKEAKSEEKEPGVIDAFFEMLKSVFKLVTAVLKTLTTLVTGHKFAGSSQDDDDQDLENDQRTPEEKEVQKKRQQNVEKGVGSAIDSVLGAAGMVANQGQVEEEKVKEGEEVEPEENEVEVEESQEVEVVNAKDKEREKEKQNDVPITSLNDVVAGSKKDKEPQQEGEEVTPEQENAKSVAKMVAGALKKHGAEEMSDHEDSNVKSGSVAKSTQKVEEQQKEGAER